MSVVQKDQLNLQGVEMLSLRESLHVEQQRYRQLWDDRETVVTRLHCQIRQLQQGRDDYYTKNQELQVGTSVQWCTHVHLHAVEIFCILKLRYVGFKCAELQGRVQILTSNISLMSDTKTCICELLKFWESRCYSVIKRSSSKSSSIM